MKHDEGTLQPAPVGQVDRVRQHFVSASCGGERCTMCGEPATHKVGEELQWDAPEAQRMRHNFTAYVCCVHFTAIFGRAVFCAA